MFQGSTIWIVIIKSHSTSSIDVHTLPSFHRSFAYLIYAAFLILLADKCRVYEFVKKLNDLGMYIRIIFLKY